MIFNIYFGKGVLIKKICSCMLPTLAESCLFSFLMLPDISFPFSIFSSICTHMICDDYVLKTQSLTPSHHPWQTQCPPNPFLWKRLARLRFPACLWLGVVMWLRYGQWSRSTDVSSLQPWPMQTSLGLWVLYALSHPKAGYTILQDPGRCRVQLWQRGGHPSTDQKHPF